MSRMRGLPWLLLTLLFGFGLSLGMLIGSLWERRCSDPPRHPKGRRPSPPPPDREPAPEPPAPEA